MKTTAKNTAIKIPAVVPGRLPDGKQQHVGITGGLTMQVNNIQTAHFGNNILLGASVTLKDLVLVPWEFDAVQLYVPVNGTEGVKTDWFVTMSCMACGKLQWYTGKGFPVAVQFKLILRSAGISTASTSEFVKVGGSENT